MKFRDVARVAKAFKIEIGGFRAQGAPAVLLAAGGLTLAAGIVRILSNNAAMLPETLREAKGLVEALKTDPNVKHLNA